MIKTHLLKCFSVAACTVLIGFSAKAQQDPYFTHYMFNKQLFNPASVGANDKYCFAAISHYQYLGYEDRTPEFWGQSGNSLEPVKKVGPKTQGFSFSAPIMARGKNHGGFGISAMTDKLGYEMNTNLRVAGAYRFTVGAGNLAIGFDYGFLQKKYGSQFYALAQNDPNVPIAGQAKLHKTVSAGVYYQNPTLNNLYVGISTTNMLPQNYSFGNNGTAVVSTVRHYYITAGMEFPGFLGNGDLVFKPSVLYKYNVANQVDLTALVEYQQRFSGGLAFRTTTDALSLMIGYQFTKGTFEGLRVGYSYDITLSRIQRVSNGTNELALNYCFTITPPPPPIRIILSPRFIKRDTKIE
ncbi:MAG: PorP/SprF family type IX secretion system membrane protein [Bacteroidia bacterium]|nr:PorP/SprF family type IX secretion system membrane protein [Bacteroidia bacterium]